MSEIDDLREQLALSTRALERANKTVEKLQLERDELVVERDNALALERDRETGYHRLEDEIADWKEATGLLAGGDPGGVTPKMLADWIGVLDGVAQAAQRLVEHEVESGDTRTHVDTGRFVSLCEALEPYRKMPES